METFEIYKFLHVAAAIVWVGSGILSAIFTFRARSASPAHTLGIARDMEFAGQRVFGPASVLTLVFGILMVVDAAAISFGDTWVAIGIGAVVVSSVIGMGLLGPQMKKLVADLEAGSSAAGARLATITKVQMLDLLVLIVAVWAMVAKPGAGG